MQMRAIADGLWVVDSERSSLAMSIPLRCTLMRLSDGTWLMHSPTDFDDATALGIDALGRVAIIVAPSGLHYLYAGAAWQRWPSAQLWAARPVAKKAPKLAPTKWFVTDVWPYSDDIGVFPLLGTKAEEILLLHRATGSLVVTDLVFNVQDPKGILTKFAYRAFGTYRRFAASKLFKKFIYDRQLFARSLAAVFEASFTRVIMTHGEILEAPNARDTLRDATQFLTQ
jgi:hypothetical protein